MTWFISCRFYDFFDDHLLVRFVKPKPRLKLHIPGRKHLGRGLGVMGTYRSMSESRAYFGAKGRQAGYLVLK